MPDPQKLSALLADGGSIVNLPTAPIRYTLPGQSTYATAKGASEALTRYLTRELGERHCEDT